MRKIIGWTLIGIGLLLAFPFFFVGAVGGSPFLWVMALALLGFVLVGAGMLLVIKGVKF